jgi:hypothetical protein
MAPLLLAAVSSYFSLVIADRACFVLFLRQGMPYGLYRADAARGHSLTPGFEGTVSTTYSFPVRINPQGYRGDPWTYDAAARFLIAGDSFVFGEPLPIEDGFVYKLNHLFPKTVRFYNAGVSSYGTVHVLETLRKECPVIHPTHIFYMYYLNDTRWDNIQADATTVMDGYLVYRYSDNGKRRLSDAEIHQKIREALEKRNAGLLSSLRLGHLREFAGARLESIRGRTSYMETTDAEAYPPQNTDIAAGHIQSMALLARSYHAAFTMVILPSYAEAHYNFKEPGTERLLEKLGRPSFSILDLRRPDARRMIHRLPKDAHYNPETTTWLADQLAFYIRKTYDIQPSDAHEK